MRLCSRCCTRERFVDCSPAQVWATLLDEGRYLCSERTMYRLLAAQHGGVRERRDQLTHPAYARPELLAERPNELWSWDITKLLGPAKWSYFYLYVILDVFSRYAVGWTVQYRETAQLAKALIEQATEQQQVEPGTLTVHADRGTPMRGKPVAFLLADLGITKTHSRPYTSTDNPYSEAHFKTLKYRPGFPDRFDTIEQARELCRGFFHWYNHAHRHSGIGLMTPAAVHHGQAQQLHAGAPPSSTPPTRATPNGSSAGRPRRPNCQPPPGSTNPKRGGRSLKTNAKRLTGLDRLRQPSSHRSPKSEPSTIASKIRPPAMAARTTAMTCSTCTTPWPPDFKGFVARPGGWDGEGEEKQGAGGVGAAAFFTKRRSVSAAFRTRAPNASILFCPTHAGIAGITSPTDVTRNPRNLRLTSRLPSSPCKVMRRPPLARQRIRFCRSFAIAAGLDGQLRADKPLGEPRLDVAGRGTGNCSWALVKPCGDSG